MLVEEASRSQNWTVLNGRFSIGAIERSPVPVTFADKVLPITPAVSERRKGGCSGSDACINEQVELVRNP